MSDIKIAYGNVTNLTFTSLNSLAASSTHLSGAESAAVDNTSGLHVDHLLSGKIVAGPANAQVGRIDVNVIAPIDDSTWPDVLDGTDSAETFTSDGVKKGICKVAISIYTEAVNDRTYYFSGISVAALFDGRMPKKYVVVITHNAHTSTNAIASSGHQVTYTPIFYTVAA